MYSQIKMYYLSFNIDEYNSINKRRSMLNTKQ